MHSPKFRVLVADDTLANRTLLRAYLARLGFETLMAEDGLQAIEQFAALRPDIVLMDLMMPGIDGFEAIRRIRAMPSTAWVPIVIVSSMDAEYDIVRGLEAGADDYMTKPLSYQVFAAKMRNMGRTLEFQRARETAIRRESAVSDAVVDGIITFDTHGTIVNCNRAGRQIFQARGAGLEGSSFLELLGDGLGERLRHTLQRTPSMDADPLLGRVVEVTACDAQRRSFPIELCISPLPGEDTQLFIGVVRDISERRRVARQLLDDAARLQSYHDEAEAEAELAKEVIERLIRREALQAQGVHHLVVPTQRFSGDMVLAARSPSGRLYGVVADATGHGLAAAMSGLAIVGDFYDSVADDEHLADMLATMNKALCRMLPSGRFVSLTAVCLDPTRRSGELFVGGMPDVLRLDATGQVVERYASSHLPLGIQLAEVSEFVTHRLQWQARGQLLLCSDGIVEASSPSGEEFGYEGLIRAVQQGGGEAVRCLAQLRAELDQHLAGQGAHDDMSVLLLDFEP